MMRYRPLPVRVLLAALLGLTAPMHIVPVVATQASGIAQTKHDTAGDADDAGKSAGRPDPCEQLMTPAGKADGLHRRCEGAGGGGGAAKGDFNGDGIADLAVGVPYEDQDGV